MARFSRILKVSLLFAALLIVTCVILREALTFYFQAKARREIALFIAEGGSTDLAALAPKPPAVEGAHLINLQELRWSRPAPLTSRAPQGGFRSNMLTPDQKIAKAYDALGKWAGFELAPAARPSHYRGRETGPPWNDEWLPHLERLLADNKGPLDATRREAETGTGYLKPDLDYGLGVSLPESAALRDASLLLRVDAIVKARNGDMPGAMEDVRLALRVPKLIDSYPFLSAKTHAMAFDLMAFQTLRGIMQFGTPDWASADAVSKELEGREERNGLTRALIGETASAIAKYRSGENLLLMPDSRGHSYDAGSGLPWLMVGVFGLRPLGQAQYLRMTRDFRAISELGCPQALKGAASLRAAYAPPGGGAIVIPNFAAGPWFLQSGIVREAQARAEVAMARTALALSLYKADTGAYPVDLSALVPKYLPSIQIDSFDGKAIRYKRVGKGYLLYSVGEDGVDNGGAYGRDMLWEAEK